MVLIPSAFFEVLFEPITDKLKLWWNNLLFILKWSTISALYLLFVFLIAFLAISIFVLGSIVCKHFGW